LPGAQGPDERSSPFLRSQREWLSKEACSIPDLPPNAEKARPEIPFLDRFVVFEKDGHFPGFAFIGFSFLVSSFLLNDPQSSAFQDEYSAADKR